MQKNFLSTPLSALLVSAALSVAASGALAQTPAPATNPTTIGVTPQDAAEATRKAVPRSDTGTLVRTDDSAAQQTRDAVDAARPSNPAAPAAILRSDNTAATDAPPCAATSAKRRAAPVLIATDRCRAHRCSFDLHPLTYLTS